MHSSRLFVSLQREMLKDYSEIIDFIHMKRRLLITLTALMLVTVTMMAVPAKPGLKKKVTLKDGTTVELSLKGDEHFSYYVDATGNACQVVDGRIVKISDEELAQTWTARRAERLDVGEDGRVVRRMGTPSNKTTGKKNGLVILMQFPDKSFVTPSPQQAFTRFFNEVGFNDYGMSGSVRDYFLAQSEGQLEINFDVVGPFTTKHNMAYYGKRYTDRDGKEQNDSLPKAMVAEAVDAAYKAGVNFSKYDWDPSDSKQEVEQVFVIYAGYGEAQGADSETIWPHEWVLTGEYSRTYNGKKIYTYACASELRGDGVNDTDRMDGIGTACHEFSHCLGLHDMYDTDGQKNFGMGYWDVMDGGSYLDDSCTPAGYTSYERWFSGWKEPEEISSMRQIENMRPIAENGSKTYVIYNKATRSQGIKGEYYLLENRQPVGFDKNLPGHGLLILHVDYNSNLWTSNKINSNKQDHQHLTIIAADNEYENYSPRSQAGDTWPGIVGNTILGNNSTPAATLYRANLDGKKLMNMPISNITEDANAMTVSFVVGAQELPVPDVDKATEKVDGNSVTVTWNAVSGATGYELEITAKDKEADFESSFDQCYSTKIGTKDIGESLKDYGLKNWDGSNLFTSPKKLAIKPGGYLMSPIWYIPSSEKITVVLGIESGEAKASGIFCFFYVNKGDERFSYSDTKDLEVKGKETLVLHMGTVNSDYYSLLFQSNDLMYINYLAVYQGYWTAEQLDFIDSQSSQASRRAVSTDTYQSYTNSCTLDNLDANKIYSYRLRAKGENGQYSGWSVEKTLTYGTTDIRPISIKADSDNRVRYYDLQGREVSPETKGLLIRKQGNEVKKVLKR